MTTSVFETVFSGIDLVPAMNGVAAGVGAQLADIVPIGVGLMLVFAIPRIVQRLIGAFL
jgi:hypothetical protein